MTFNGGYVLTPEYIMPKPTKPSCGSRIRRIIWDIEVSPNVVFSWSCGYKLTISPDNIVKERKIICICWKWEDETEVHALRWDKNQDDKEMLKKFLVVANGADELAAHYGDGFDMPWFRARCLIHGLEPLPLYKTIDTKAWAAKNFYFNSNKLDYLGSVLGYGHKLHTGFQLWIDVVNGSQKALDYMVKYCKKDVLLLEKVYKRLAACVRPKSHVGVLEGKPKHTCPHCGEDRGEHQKVLVSAAGTIKHRIRCCNCGHYYDIADSVYKKSNISSMKKKGKKGCK